MRLKSVKNPVLDQHVVEFDSYILKWQKRLGLHGWRVEPDDTRAKHAMAEIIFDDEAKLAVYRIGRDFGTTPVNPKTLESTALHELLHVLLRKFRTDPSEANEHEIVNTLETLLMEAKFD